MTRVTDLLELPVPGVSSINWNSQLRDLVHDYCSDDIYRRRSRFDLSLFGLGPCSRREAVIGRTRHCFEHEVITHLNFCHGRLCAVHQFFPTVAGMEAQEYYSALDGIRRRLCDSLGAPSLQTHIHSPSQVSFRWNLKSAHAELRSCDGAKQDLSLAVNDPSVCAWCMYWQ